MAGFQQQGVAHAKGDVTQFALSGYLDSIIILLQPFFRACSIKRGVGAIELGLAEDLVDSGLLFCVTTCGIQPAVPFRQKAFVSIPLPVPLPCLPSR
jgi:hypothetical protein